MLNFKELVIELFKTQEQLNVKFSGDNWMDIPRELWVTAAQKEYAEFLDEITLLWKWWLPDDTLKFDADKALEELVDTLMFTISSILIEYPDIRVWVDNHSSTYLADVPDDDKTFSKMSEYSVRMLSPHNSSQFCSVCLCYFIESALTVIDKSHNDLLDAYNAKYEKNLARLEAGYRETGNKEGLE